MNKQQHFDLLRNYKGGDEMEIDIKIDSLTNCLISEETHEEFDTEYKLFRKTISTSQAKELQNSGWLFDWSIPQMKGEEVFGLYIIGSDELQGLIALKHVRQNYFTFVDVVESAPHNRGKNKKFSGVGAHLFAIACKLSFEVGNDGYVSFLAKTNLVNHYAKTLGATSISTDGRKMVITTESSIKLLRSTSRRKTNMIVGERKEKFNFGHVSEILGETDKHNLDHIDDIDLWTEPWPAEPVYKIREIELEVRRLGRGLTDEEMEKFRAD